MVGRHKCTHGPDDRRDVSVQQLPDTSVRDTLAPIFGRSSSRKRRAWAEGSERTTWRTKNATSRFITRNLLNAEVKNLSLVHAAGTDVATGAFYASLTNRYPHRRAVVTWERGRREG